MDVSWNNTVQWTVIKNYNVSMNFLVFYFYIMNRECLKNVYVHGNVFILTFFVKHMLNNILNT